MPTPSSTAEETTRALRRLADADEKQRNADHQRADQERDDGRQHEIDRVRRHRRRQHADEMHGPDADREKERRRRPAAGDGSRPASRGCARRGRSRCNLPGSRSPPRARRDRDRVLSNMIVSAARLHGRASSRRRVYRRGGGNDNRPIASAVRIPLSLFSPPNPGPAESAAARDLLCPDLRLGGFRPRQAQVQRWLLHRRERYRSFSPASFLAGLSFGFFAVPSRYPAPSSYGSTNFGGCRSRIQTPARRWSRTRARPSFRLGSIIRAFPWPRGSRRAQPSLRRLRTLACLPRSSP